MFDFRYGPCEPRMRKTIGQSGAKPFCDELYWLSHMNCGGLCLQYSLSNGRCHEVGISLERKACNAVQSSTTEGKLTVTGG